MIDGIDVIIEGFNEQIRIVRDASSSVGDTRFTEAQFSDEVELRRVASSVDELEPLSRESYCPAGGTALYDALGQTIAALLRTEHIHSADTAVLVTIFTDGEDNASKRYFPGLLADLVRRLEATGRWTFALIGPCEGVLSLGKLLAIKASNIAGYDPYTVDGLKSAFVMSSAANSTFMESRSVHGAHGNQWTLGADEVNYDEAKFSRLDAATALRWQLYLAVPELREDDLKPYPNWKNVELCGPPEFLSGKLRYVYMDQFPNGRILICVNKNSDLGLGQILDWCNLEKDPDEHELEFLHTLSGPDGKWNLYGRKRSILWKSHFATAQECFDQAIQMILAYHAADQRIGYNWINQSN